MKRKLIARILWRLLFGVGVLWGAATLTFVTMNLTGGDTAIAILGGPDALPTPEVLARVRADYGLDQPLRVQYAHYIVRLLHGDLGESYRLRIPVTKAIGQQIGATVQLGLCAAPLAVAVALFFAILTAKRSAWVRSFSSGAELVVSSMPSFALGILFLLVFSFHFHVLPSSGTKGWKTMVLPVLTLVAPVAGILTQVLRRELEEIMEQPFIMMARARGMSDIGVRLQHAMRHAMIPLITLSGFLFASLLGGAVVVETLFSRQGVGRLMVDATANKDVPLVLGITIMAALVYVVINLLVDIVYALIDPRVAAA